MSWRVVSPAARAAAPELSQADLLEDVVGRRAEDEQVPLAGWNGDLERAVALAGDDGLPFADDLVTARDWRRTERWRRPAAGRFLPRPPCRGSSTPRGSTISIALLTAPLFHSNRWSGIRYGWPSGG